MPIANIASINNNMRINQIQNDLGSPNNNHPQQIRHHHSEDGRTQPMPRIAWIKQLGVQKRPSKSRIRMTTRIRPRSPLGQ